jgi:hypothetical protein
MMPIIDEADSTDEEDNLFEQIPALKKGYRDSGI